jgi:phenylpyruvate tautomerase PptA (4-oxalocrotonate tautomerase family)
VQRSFRHSLQLSRAAYFHRIYERLIMPVIRIEVPEATKPESKKRIREQVKQAVLTTLAPKETKYDYVAIREVFGEIGDGLPLVEVDLRPGREPARKKALVDAIADVLNEELGIKPEDVYVLFRETPAPGHYTGGTPLPEWVPADR